MMEHDFIVVTSGSRIRKRNIFADMYDAINRQNLVASKIIMNQQDYDDIIKWMKDK